MKSNDDRMQEFNSIALWVCNKLGMTRDALKYGFVPESDIQTILQSFNEYEIQREDWNKVVDFLLGKGGKQDDLPGYFFPIQSPTETGTLFFFEDPEDPMFDDSTRDVFADQ